VHEARRFNKDKFIDGNEANADFIGFLAEFAFASVFELPRPVLYANKEVDKYDFLIEGKRIDLKASKDCLINKLQFERKKGDLDVFIFCKTELIDYKAGKHLLHVFGWCKYEDVVKFSKLKEFDNGSSAYSVSKKRLKSLDKLFGVKK